MFCFSGSPAGLAALPRSGRMAPGSRRRQGQACVFQGAFLLKARCSAGSYMDAALAFPAGLHTGSKA